MMDEDELYEWHLEQREKHASLPDHLKRSALARRDSVRLASSSSLNDEGKIEYEISVYERVTEPENGFPEDFEFV